MDRSVDALSALPPIPGPEETPTDRKTWITPAVSESSFVDLTLAGTSGINPDAFAYS